MFYFGSPSGCVIISVCVTSVHSTLIVATGMWQPIQPRIEGEEYLEDYETVSTDAQDFEGQTVLILGLFFCCLLTIEIYRDT